jgi:hypothetical protein
MSEELIPESRGYRHRTCGCETTVSGEAFQGISNPMSTMVLTFCSKCSSYYPVSEFEWSDTGEAITEYWTRYSAHATPLQRFLTSRKFMLLLILMGAATLGIGSVLYLSKNHLFDRILGGLGGSFVGAIVGLVAFSFVFSKPITRSVCGVSDTRALK